MKRIMLAWLLMLLSSVSVYGLDSLPITDTFASSNDGWSGGTASSGQYIIAKDGLATKTYDFGSANAGRRVSVSLSFALYGGWESSGGQQDYLNITLNGETNTTSYGNGSTSPVNGSLNGIIATLDSNGRLVMRINPDTTHNEEMAYINEVTVSPTVSNNGGRDFFLRKQLYAQGNMKTIGNTILVNPTNSKTTNSCSTYTNGTFLDGDGSSSNADYFLCGYSVDGTQTNATTSELALPVGAEVIWAGLYWQSIVANGSFSTDMSVKIRRNSGSYETIRPDQLDYQADAGAAGYTSYSAFKDVSHLFGSGKWNEGNYTVADIPVYEGKIASLGSYGAWALVAVYQVNGELFRSFSVFDGWKVVKTASAGTEVTVPVTVSGFYTPNKTSLNAKVSVFAAEGDAYFGTSSDREDVLYTTNYNTNTRVNLGNTYNTFHSEISGGGYRLPSMTNNMGIDILTFDIGAYLKPKQESMTFNFATKQDTYWPSVLAFSTEIYTPKFCYDYGYQQNGLPFTESNDGVTLPRLTGTLPNSADINMSIYIRNTEVSDIAANNTYFHVNNIDTDQAVYVRDTTAITFPRQYIPTRNTDSGWPVNVSDGYIRNIPVGDVDSSEYFYIYYTLRPHSSGDINMSIDGTFGYDLTITRSDGSKLIIPYGSKIGGEALPMCSPDNFSYTPTWGIFSMVDAGLYDNTTSNQYYDLTTQVVRRPANLRIASFRPDQLDTPQNVSTMVAVELIDASKFHDVDAACREPSSALTPRVWVGFENNVSQVNFNAATIQEAIAGNRVSDVLSGLPVQLSSPDDFYAKATPNAAFRITYNTLNDADGSLIDIKNTTQGLRIDNFEDIHRVYPHCRKPVKNPNNFGLTDMTAVACSNSGNNSTWGDIAICMECLYGADTKVLCSRDNFAIRPESYTITLKDGAVDISPNRTGVPLAALNTDQVKMSAGYPYNYELTATNHRNNAPSLGYTRYFGTADNDYNVSLSWNSLKTGCNDTSSRAQSFNMINGMVVDDANHSQVGEYLLNIIDKTWTQVDWNSMYQTHQQGSHFLGGAECVMNSTYVPTDSSVVSLSGGVMTNLVGCDIRSQHDNIQALLAYRDLNVAFRPDTFDLSAIRMATGSDFNGSIMNANAWTYMNTLTETPDMGVRYSGQIRAVGDNNETLSNFVTDCYAEPLHLDMNLIYPTTAGLPNWRYRLQEVNASTGDIWRDTNAVIASPATNTAFPILTLPQTSFLKSQNGMVDVKLTINYDRNQTLPVNPVSVGLRDFQISCETDLNCNSMAHGSVNHLPDELINTNNTTTFVYGRLNTKDIRVFGANSFSANGWYEVFNLPLYEGASLQPSRNGTNWFINAMHDDASHGDANVTRLISAGAAATVNYGGNDVMGVETFVFPAIAPIYNGKAHVDTAPWLWHTPNALTYSDPSTTNPANAAGNEAACLTHPCFNVTVMPAIGVTGSAKQESEGNKASKGSTGGGGWRSTSDYAPAIR